MKYGNVPVAAAVSNFILMLPMLWVMTPLVLHFRRGMDLLRKQGIGYDVVYKQCSAVTA